MTKDGTIFCFQLLLSSSVTEENPTGHPFHYQYRFPIRGRVLGPFSPTPLSSLTLCNLMKVAKKLIEH